MVLLKKSDDLRKWLENQAKTPEDIGFVPTMGALHAGHISLVNSSRSENRITVCSIFVNPAQFNDPADFDKYPNTIDTDIDKLESAGCDVLFLPAVSEMYPNGQHNDKHYDLGYLENILEGAYRPGHFQGVCMIVEKLLDIVEPGVLYLGQKDYQQCMVIARLIQLMNRDYKTKVKICPTLRESDGLAMSSRNMRLNKEERDKAITISRVLNMIRENIRPGNIDNLISTGVFILEEEGFRVDYVAVAEAENLQPVTDWDGKKKLVALAAAFINEVRLIDNMII